MIRLRRPQLRLQTLLVLVALAALPVAWFAAQYRDYEREREIAERLRRPGVTLTFRDGPWYFPQSTSVIAVHFHGSAPPTLAELDALAELSHLERLGIQDSVPNADAWAALAKLRHLRLLQLLHCPIDDEQLQQVAALPNLRELTLEATQTTEQGLDRLRAKLPQLEIYDD